MATSYYNNDSFSKIVDHTVNTNSLPTALASNGLSTLKQVSGVVTPTLAGNYAVQNNGLDVTLPAGALVQAVILRGADLLGGTSLQPIMASDSGLADGTALTAAAVLADIVLGAAPAVTAVVGQVDTFLSLIAIGLFTAGECEVIITYL